jgi:hypothetical protein
MSETGCLRVVPVNTVAGASVKFQFSESMSFDPMSIRAHAATHVASQVALQLALNDSAPMASLSVRARRQIAFTDMSETAAPGTVVDLTLYDPRGRLSLSLLEFSIAIAFDGRGEPSK